MLSEVAFTLARFLDGVIRGFRHRGLKRLWEGDPSRFLPTWTFPDTVCIPSKANCEVIGR